MMSQQHKNGLMQQLKVHFNLVSDPFSADSQFYFEGAQRQHNLETLRHLASFGDMVLFVTADKGAGKTFLLSKLVNASFEGLNIIYLDCEQIIQGSSKYSSPILSACFRLLGLKEPEGSNVDLLNTLLTECHRLVAVDGVRTLFAFDNANKIPKKELQEYCSFCKELPSESALVMLFAGSSALIQSSKLGGHVDQDAWWHQVQLKPFSRVDVLAYLEQALSLAGHQGKLELTELQIQQLVELGKGLPGRINKLLPSVILEPGLLKIKKKSKPNGGAAKVMFGLAALLVASFIFVSYQHGLFKNFIPVFSFEDELETYDKQVLDVVEERKKVLDQESAQQRSRLAMLDSVLQEKGIKLPEAQNQEDNQTLEMLEEDLSVESIVETKEESASLEAVELELELAQESKKELGLADEATKELEIKASEPKAEVNKSVKPTVDKVELKKDHPAFRPKSWLQEQSAGAYLAQILGSYSEETALKFINKVGKKKFDVFYLETEHKGKPWFVVFYGVYPAKTHAQNAVKNSPKVIRSQNPWIRRSVEVLASYPK